METLTDLAMNAGSMAILNYSGVSGQIDNITGTSAIGRAVSAALASQSSKYLSHMLYQWGVYKIPMSTNTPSDLKQWSENVLYDSAAFYLMDQFDAYDRLSAVIPGDDLLSVAVKQGALITAADVMVDTARKTGLLAGSDRVIGGLEDRLVSFY